MSEAYQGMHQRQLPWIVQFQAGNAFTAGKHGGLGQLLQLASVDKGFQDVLLDVEVVVADGRQPVSQLGQVFHRLFDPIVGDVIGSRLGAQAQVIADILLEEAVSIVATDHWVRKIEILDDGLKLSLVLLGDLATEDRGDLVGLADRTVGIQQSLAELIQCGPPVKDQVVTIFHLGEEEPVLTAASLRSLSLKNGVRQANHFCPQLSRSWAVKESANSWSFCG